MTGRIERVDREATIAPYEIRCIGIFENPITGEQSIVFGSEPGMAGGIMMIMPVSEWPEQRTKIEQMIAMNDPEKR